MPRTMQPSFAGGEIAPALAGRVDLARYAVSARTIKNMIVHPSGGVSKRAGTKYIGVGIGNPANVAAIRLIPFQFNADQAYVLEFTPGKMRIIKDGGLVTDGGNIVEIVSPFYYAGLLEMRYAQSADTMFFAHPSYPPWKLTRSSHTAWTFTQQTFTPTLQAPTGITASYSATPSASSRDVIYRVSAIDENGDESLPSVSSVVTIDSPWGSGQIVTISWNAVVGAETYNVYKNERGFYGLIGTLGTDYVRVKDGASNATVSDNGHTGAYVPANAFDSNNATYWQSLQTGASVSGAAWVQRYFGDNSGATVSAAVSRIRIRNGIVGYPGYAVTSSILQYSADGSSWTPLQTFALSDDPSIWQDLYATTASVSAPYWRLVANSNPTYCWIIGELELYELGVQTTFRDDNIAPDAEYGPQQSDNPFDAANAYPGAVALFQQRLMFARSNNRPQTVWGTRTGGLNNMAVSFPVRDDDAINVTIASGQVDEIRHMVPMRTLLLFTAGSEWEMAPGSQADALSPLSVRFNIGGYRGCSDVAPITVGDSVLFIQRDGKTVRDLFYQLESDGYQGTDLSVWAKHLFEGRTIVSWAYQQHPDSILWAVMSDGTLLSFTYMKEHQVFAWTQHDTKGYFKSVAVIPGVSNDEVYFVVDRTLNGTRAYFLEELDTDVRAIIYEDMVQYSYHVDCGATYLGTATTSISGLTWLKNTAVVGLADGAAVAGTVSNSGVLVIPGAAVRVHVGLGYTADLETLPIDLNGQDGASHGKRKRVSRLVARFQRTVGCAAGPDEDHLTEMKFRTDEAWGVATQMFSGDKELVISPKWGRDGRVLLRSEGPLPFTVLAVIPEVEVGD